MAVASGHRIARDDNRDSAAEALPVEGLFILAHEFSLRSSARRLDREATAIRWLRQVAIPKTIGRPARDTAWTMSAEDVETVRRHTEAWNRRDLTTWLALSSSGAEIDWSRSRGPLKGVYRRHGELEVFWDAFWSTFEDVQVEMHGFTEVGSEVVVPNTAHIRGRQGIEVVARSTFVFTVENGQITRLRLFQERAEALEAVGLSE